MHFRLPMLICLCYNMGKHTWRCFMGKFGAFDIIGPRMIGPSSSHTAGAAKLSRLARKIADDDVKSAVITLYGSFAETGKGHGTDKALCAGLLGFESDDARLRYALLLAEEADIDIKFIYSDEEPEHPNHVKLEITGHDGKTTVVEGNSVGGGNVEITSINNMHVKLTGEYPALIVHYIDRPGMISRVTDLLAEQNVNVAFMRVFRTGRREDACMVIETDTPVTGDIVNAIYKINSGVFEVRTV